MNLRQLIAHEAMNWIGVPFLHQGRAMTGVDCIGLPSAVVQAIGGRVTDFLDYGEDPQPSVLLAGLEANCDRIDEPEVGDLWSFWITDSTKVKHVGIIVPTGFIHAYKPHRRVMLDEWNARWLKRRAQAWRVRWRQ